MGRLLNESFIRQRSEELRLPFENLLSAQICESYAAADDRIRICRLFLDEK